MCIDITTKLVNNIHDKRQQWLKSKIVRYPRNNFIASDIVECDRYMVYSQLDWDKRPVQDEELQALFDAGNDAERIVIRDLLDMGFNIAEQQTPFEIKNKQGKMIARGKVDGKIIYERIAIPFEIKLMSSLVFNSINTASDLKKKPFHKKYLKQIQLYLYGNNIESGFFIITDGRGYWKLLTVSLDYELCESILQQLERCQEYVDKKEYPERINYDSKLCDRCAFSHLCLPDGQNKEANFINNEELENMLDRYTEIKSIAKEYEEIHEQIKSTFKSIPESFVGTNYRIISKPQFRNSLDTSSIPEDIKNKYTKQNEIWITKVLKI